MLICITGDMYLKVNVMNKKKIFLSFIGIAFTLCFLVYMGNVSTVLLALVLFLIIYMMAW